MDSEPNISNGDLVHKESNLSEKDIAIIGEWLGIHLDPQKPLGKQLIDFFSEHHPSIPEMLDVVINGEKISLSVLTAYIKDPQKPIQLGSPVTGWWLLHHKSPDGTEGIDVIAGIDNRSNQPPSAAQLSLRRSNENPAFVALKQSSRMRASDTPFILTFPSPQFAVRQRAVELIQNQSTFEVFCVRNTPPPLPAPVVSPTIPKP